MNYPEALKKGDLIALIAPSSPVTEDQAAAAKALVEGWGYRVRMSSLVQTPLHGYEAGAPEARLNELNGAFSDPEVRAVLCLRGGDSSCRILPGVDVEAVRRNPKIFVGYSDITPLHALFNQRADLVTFHGPMVVSNMLDHFDPFTEESFWRALTLPPGGTLEFRNPEGCSLECLSAGSGAAQGPLVGGNLALLTSLLGTPYETDTRGKILLIEDVNESVPRVSRMLHHLRYAGKLEDAAGVIVGDFTNCPNEKAPNFDVRALMRDFFAGYGKPVLAGVRTGHDFPMGTLPLGALCRLDAKAMTLSFSRK